MFKNNISTYNREVRTIQISRSQHQKKIKKINHFCLCRTMTTNAAANLQHNSCQGVKNHTSTWFKYKLRSNSEFFRSRVTLSATTAGNISLLPLINFCSFLYLVCPPYWSLVLINCLLIGFSRLISCSSFQCGFVGQNEIKAGNTWPVSQLYGLSQTEAA